MKILIPPSEGKSEENTTSIKFKDTNYKFTEEVRGILNNLSDYDTSNLQKIYGTSIEKSKDLHIKNLRIFESECSPAMNRYTGVVYNNLNPLNLDKNSKEFLNENFLIASALLGLVSPNELIPFYKLKMNVFKLFDYWKPIFTNFLKNEDLIVDLLPEIHRKSYKSENVLKINFLFIKSGEKISSGHNGKAIKGQYLRYVVENQISTEKGLKSFSQDGFEWSKKDQGYIKEV